MKPNLVPLPQKPRLFTGLVIVLVSLFATACAQVKPLPVKPESDSPAASTAKKITNQAPDSLAPPSLDARYEIAKSALMAGNFTEAVHQFRILDVMAAEDAKAENTKMVQARIELAYAYYRIGDDASALAVAERFIHHYPDHSNLDYLYYLRGLTHYRMAKQGLVNDQADSLPPEAHLSIREFRALIQRFPDSKYSQDARQRIAELEDSMARQGLSLAKRMISAGHYAAAGLHAHDAKDRSDDPAITHEAKTLLDMIYRQLSLEVAAKKPKKKSVVQLRTEAWIMAQKPSDLTLQLLGTSHEKSLRRFIHNAELKGDMAYFESKASGQPWYTLIYGRYTNRATAQKISERLLEQAPAIKPWIRSMGEIQSLITGMKSGAGQMAATTQIQDAVEGSGQASETAAEPADQGKAAAVPTGDSGHQAAAEPGTQADKMDRHE